MLVKSVHHNLFMHYVFISPKPRKTVFITIWDQLKQLNLTVQKLKITRDCYQNRSILSIELQLIWLTDDAFALLLYELRLELDIWISSSLV